MHGCVIFSSHAVLLLLLLFLRQEVKPGFPNDVVVVVFVVVYKFITKFRYVVTSGVVVVVL